MTCCNQETAQEPLGRFSLVPTLIHQVQHRQIFLTEGTLSLVTRVTTLPPHIQSTIHQLHTHCIRSHKHIGACRWQMLRTQGSGMMDFNMPSTSVQLGDKPLSQVSESCLTSITYLGSVSRKTVKKNKNTKTVRRHPHYKNIALWTR